MKYQRYINVINVGRHPYSLNEYGYCEMCILTGSIVNNECITCNDLSKGGVENCKYCQIK